MTEDEIKALIDGIAPVIKQYVDQSVAYVLARVTTVEASAAFNAGAVASMREYTANMRERLAILETRAPVPGPVGADGAPGRDGLDGKDGAPGLRYLGVYQDGKAYATGDVVTWGGSAWHCHDATDAKPGNGSAAWQLMVKHGRDAKEGKP